MQLEEYFLGVTANKPTPSVSGEGGPKHILVFHCEFSAKRAPTLYARFRILNFSSHSHIRLFQRKTPALEGSCH